MPFKCGWQASESAVSRVSGCGFPHRGNPVLDRGAPGNSPVPGETTGSISTLAAVLAVQPGAFYTWGFERVAGRWGIGLSDRLFRFAGISALFHALLAPVTYGVWDTYFRSGAERAGDLAWWLWPLAIAYVLVPVGLGTWIAHAFNANQEWAVRIVRPTSAPTAWDALFSGNPVGTDVLMKLKSGWWVGGRYDDGSYVGGYPEPADIYLITELKVDQETGDFARDANGDELPVGSGLLVRWDEVECLEVSD